MSRVIVVGASSGIGAALVRAMAAAGDQVVAVARRAPELEALASSCGASVRVVVHDVTDTAAVPAAFRACVDALGGVDVLVYAAGVMPRIGPDELDGAKDRHIFEVNLIGAAAWLDEGGAAMAAQGSGVLVGIGSVAGDRGRMGNPAYCASKAGLHALLEALRNRLDRKGVTVLTVKPGPVRTPMVEGRTDLPLLIEADDAAQQVIAAIRARRQQVYVPWLWGPIMAVVRSIPSILFRRMSL